ncbi:MAG: TrpB-like pyridoxal phosphate-dependent enzyme [Candidatus Binatia bacterium]|nr:TrpB-like pyridoxal phosphate-dependent enzyme [Candidatus Binatia bacterium]
MADPYKISLPENKIPTAWFNIVPFLPHPPAPPLHPVTQQPIGVADLAPLFCDAILAQETATAPEIEIPEPVREIYRLWRPTPLYRARRLERVLDTPAHIYYKYEGVSPAGSHKPNTAVAQAYYNKEAGIRRLTTETGAGQWGSALALAGAFFEIEVKVYMVRVSYEQKPYRRHLMETWGAHVVPSPSPHTEAGRRVLAEHPDSPGSLGLAISEAVEEAASRADTNYALGSVLNHVLLHQTVIGLEALEQFVLAGEGPDVLIACCGGGSNFAGFTFPFLPRKRAGESLRIIAVEPAACPTLTKGVYAYDFGDMARLSPLLKMYTLGHGFVPPGIHAGGLRYHGDAPLVSQLVHDGVVEAVAYAQRPVFAAAVTFARAEGIIPAPESAHAIKAAIDEALSCRESGEKKVIAFCLSGHGHFDMAAYERYLSGTLVDAEYSEAEVQRAISELPQVRT